MEPAITSDGELEGFAVLVQNGHGFDEDSTLNAVRVVVQVTIA
jgi:hypothetical protein